MENFKKLFPILNDYTYLNTPASGLLSVPVMEWRRSHDQAFLKKGSIIKENQSELLTTVREKVGTLFNCATNRVALVPNFSYGFNTLLEGISNTKKVLLIEGDYPSVNWPFESRTFDITYAKNDFQIEEHIEKAFANKQPDIFAFSLVQWINGLQIDHHFLKQLKDRYPETLFLGDATQYLGTTVFNFEQSAFDVLGASTYKWMNAGYGNAVYLFKEPVADRVAPKTTGFNSIQGKYKPQEGSFLGRFEPGHQDTLNYGSLGKAIDVINDIKMQNIESLIQDINKHAKEIFLEKKLISPELAHRSTHGAFYNINGDENTVKKLKELDILTIARGEGVRVGFHYFNTQEDLLRLLDAL